MGRRLNVSTPTVINTELVPLDESFYLDVDGQMEQWYYDNTEQYAPNRKVTPLLLVPVISAFDKDTSTSYTPAFNTTQWFANEWNETQGKYVETEITNQVDSGSADYVIQGNNLLVKKNVSYSHAVTIRCVATYIDPRDSGVTYTVEDSVNLTTNRTADVVFPEVDIISPSGRSYNPLVDDENSQYDFKGVTTNNPVQPLNTDVRRYPVDVDGTEEILNSGEAVAPIMDIRYGENPTMTDQEFMYRQTAGGTLVGESIDKAYIERIKGNTVAWNQIISNANETQGSTGIILNIYTSSYFVVDHKYFCSAQIKKDESSIFSALWFGLSQGANLYGGNTEINYSNIETSYKQFRIIVRNNDSRNNGVNFYSRNYQEGSIYVKEVICIDLTLIYGAGNEPETVEEFEADYERWFGKPLTYEPYDAGSLKPVLMQSVKTTGFNQWDEEWESGYVDFNDGENKPSSNSFRSKNFIPILPNKVYNFYCSSIPPTIFGGNIAWYDANHEFISSEVGSQFESPSNARYAKFYVPWNAAGYPSGNTYNHDICINISDPSRNGTYEPYEEKVQGFDVTAIKGKLNGAGESITIFPDGLKKCGEVYDSEQEKYIPICDEIFVEGGVVKAIKRVGSVDLGSMSWDYASTVNGNRYMTGNQIAAKIPSSSEDRANILCWKYKTQSYAATYAEQEGVSIAQVNSAVRIYDKQYNTGDYAAFKSAMNGVMLYYELATPKTYVLDPITDFVWYGIKNGQEVLADTLPWYVSGQGTDNLVVDAMYGENINVVLRCKMMDGETLSPSKAYATLSWRLPDIETFVQSENGGAVRSDTEEMTFDTIVNINGDVLSDALKQKHLAFNWKIHKDNAAPNTPEAEIDKGWGQRITIDASDLRNVRQTPSSTLASTLVYNHVYLKGAYEEVTDNGEVVTDNGEKVYDRPID